MRVLALDTTTRAGSLALLDDDRLVVEREGDAARTHAERLPGEIDALLAEAGVGPSALDLLVVASGPGAFTGLRIGIATVQGLAMVLDRPAIGVSALDALAWAARGGAAHVVAWVDAGRGEVFAARYAWAPGDDGPPVDSPVPVVGTATDLLDEWRAHLAPGTLFVGDAARAHAALVTGAGGYLVSADAPRLAAPLGRIGRGRAAAGLAGPPHALQPLYVRRPDAVLERERREAAERGGPRP